MALRVVAASAILGVASGTIVVDVSDTIAETIVSCPHDPAPCRGTGEKVADDQLQVYWSRRGGQIEQQLHLGRNFGKLWLPINSQFLCYTTQAVTGGTNWFIKYETGICTKKYVDIAVYQPAEGEHWDESKAPEVIGTEYDVERDAPIILFGHGPPAGLTPPDNLPFQFIANDTRTFTRMSLEFPEGSTSCDVEGSKRRVSYQYVCSHCQQNPDVFGEEHIAVFCSEDGNQVYVQMYNDNDPTCSGWMWDTTAPLGGYTTFEGGYAEDAPRGEDAALCFVSERRDRGGHVVSKHAMKQWYEITPMPVVELSDLHV